MKTILLNLRAGLLASSLLLTATFMANGQPVYFQDNFDSFGSPSTVTASGNGINGYNIKFSSGNPTTENFTAIFGFDYSTWTYPIAIPSAPNSSGTTKGLYLTVNKSPAFPNGLSSGVAPGTNAAVNLYPVGGSFSGDYKVRYDVWMNWTNVSFSTEAAMVGINHSGTMTNQVAKIGSDGIFTEMVGDGGNGATSTTARDFSLFQGKGGATAPLLYRTNNQAFAIAPGSRFDNTDTALTALFPSKTIAGYPTTPVGSPGLGWVTGEIWQTNNVITWLLNGTIVAQFANTNSYTAGDIMLGYNDVFNSMGDTNNFAIFDNIIVYSAVPEPSVAVLTIMGMGAVGFYFRRRQGRQEK
jgi:hypothetical protein